VVGKSYPALVRLVFTAASAWIDIEGEALWRGISPWGFSIAQWCTFIERWIRRRVEEDPERLKEVEAALARPEPRLRLYTVGRPPGERPKAMTYDSNFAAAVQVSEQAKG